MGLGRYQNGAFHLVASSRYPADQTASRNDPRRTRGAALEGVDEQVPTPPVPSFARRYAGTLVVG